MLAELRVVAGRSRALGFYQQVRHARERRARLNHSLIAIDTPAWTLPIIPVISPCTMIDSCSRS